MEPTDGPPLDEHQYTVAGLRAYEGIYGRDFVSPGGRRTTADILARLDWRPAMSVLDVGCGLGGAIFMIATDFGGAAVGIDLSTHMAEAAAERATNYGLDASVTVLHGDIMTHELPSGFDIVHSREVFLHIHDKPALFARLLDLLVPEGQLLFTDYCRGLGLATSEFDEYVTEFGYDLRTVDEIGMLLSEAGFTNVRATDQTNEFISIHQRELDELGDSGLTTDEQDELRTGWLAKIERAEQGEQRWGMFEARRPAG